MCGIQKRDPYKEDCFQSGFALAELGLVYTMMGILPVDQKAWYLFRRNEMIIDLPTIKMPFGKILLKYKVISIHRIIFRHVVGVTYYTKYFPAEESL